ncbi:MAG TPA: hypothetical protein VHO84_14355 [Syntrophorhabdaceae bacterium]|nr:hypothetical protein [Syntrophorhabdaceae bacterium]
MKKLLVCCSIVVLLIGIAAFHAEAKAITGGVSFGGGFVVVPADLDIATAITFPTGGEIPNSGAGSFDFSALVPGTRLDMPGFTFNTLIGTPTLWDVTISGIAYEFALTSANILTQTGTTLSLFGEGIARITGFDDTPGIWNLTANSISGTSSFSASTGAVSTPEPGMLLLLGCGLIALVGSVRGNLKSRVIS